MVSFEKSDFDIKKIFNGLINNDEGEPVFSEESKSNFKLYDIYRGLKSNFFQLKIQILFLAIRFSIDLEYKERNFK